MSVRALVSAIEADPVKQEQSYTLMKEALLGSYGMTKWQMAYSLLDHPDLGDRRPSAMMAEMLSLRFETTAPDSLFLALFGRGLHITLSPSKKVIVTLATSKDVVDTLLIQQPSISRSKERRDSPSCARFPLIKRQHLCGQIFHEGRSRMHIGNWKSRIDNLYYQYVLSLNNDDNVP